MHVLAIIAPRVTGHEIAQSAIFAIHRGTLAAYQRKCWRQIRMIIFDMPYLIIHMGSFCIDPTVAHYQPRRIKRHYVFREPVHIVQSPMLIKYGPHDNTGVTPMLIHHITQFRLKLHLIRLRTCKVSIAARHVLPYQYTELIAMVIPPLGFYLHMFAYHIKSPILYVFDIPPQSVVGRCSKDAIRPISLIERAMLVKRFTVQTEPRYLIEYFHRYFTHSRITFDAVDHLFIFIQKLYLHIIQIRIGR